ncbi:MAG: thiol-disulfide oxidoreductase DCC family protein [Tepidisphaeraceae bacterium]
MMPPTPGSHGTLLFDGNCGMCSATESRWRTWLQRHGFQTGFLQDDAFTNFLPASLGDNPRGLLLLTPTGQTLVGVDALAAVADTAGWARPIAFLMRLPGLHPLARIAYAWVARRRQRISQLCRLPPARPAPSLTETTTAPQQSAPNRH